MNISEQFLNRTVWQQFIDPKSGLLLLELRKASDRSLSYMVYSLSTHTMVSDFTPNHDEWWNKVVLFYDEKIVFTRFKDESPEVQGTYISNLSGEIFWSDDTCSPIIENNKIKIDSALVKNNNEVSSLFTKTIEEPKIIQPLSYLAETDHFNTVASFLKEKLKCTPIEVIEYLEFNQKIVISFHTLTNNRIENSIIVLDTGGNILFHDSISSERKGIGFGTFYVYKNQCIYIKNLEYLKTIAL